MRSLPTVVQWAKRMARTVAGPKTRALALGGVITQRTGNRCATVATPGICNQSASARFSKHSGAGTNGTIRTAFVTRLMTFWADRQNKQVDFGMETDEKQEELEDKTRFAAFFKATCVRSTEYCKFVDDVFFERGRPIKEEIKKKWQQKSSKEK